MTSSILQKRFFLFRVHLNVAWLQPPPPPPPIGCITFEYRKTEFSSRVFCFPPIHFFRHFYISLEPSEWKEKKTLKPLSTRCHANSQCVSLVCASTANCSICIYIKTHLKSNWYDVFHHYCYYISFVLDFISIIFSSSLAFVPFIDVKRAVKLNNSNKMVLQQTKKVMR